MKADESIYFVRSEAGRLHIYYWHFSEDNEDNSGLEQVYREFNMKNGVPSRIVPVDSQSIHQTNMLIH